MLNGAMPSSPARRPAGTGRGRLAPQSGVVLILVLIVLVSMTLAAIALMRSTFSSNLIAGNLAFQQSATNSADSAVEDAIAWLEANSGGTTLTCTASAAYTSLMCNQSARAYYATRTDPASTSNWATYFGSVTSYAMYSGGTDNAGNSVRYIIQRMCNAVGDPTLSATGCSASPASWSTTNSSMGGEVVGLKSSAQIYYRITVQVSSGRNTVSYVQAVVAI